MKTLRILLLFALLGVLAASVRAEAPPVAPMKIDGAATVDYQGVISLIESNRGVVVVDARGSDDYKRGHIATAININGAEMTDARVLARHVAAKDAPVLFYCQGIHCGHAAVAVRAALGWGYTRVYYYATGMDEWLGLGLPVERSAPLARK